MEPKSAFRKYIGDLTHVLSQQEDLIPLAMQFYSEGIITIELKNHVLDSSTGTNAQLKAAKLLSAIEQYVCDKPYSIHTVIRLLGNSGSCKGIAERMGQDLMSEDTEMSPSALLSHEQHLSVKRSLFSKQPTFPPYRTDADVNTAASADIMAHLSAFHLDRERSYSNPDTSSRTKYCVKERSQSPQRTPISKLTQSSMPERSSPPVDFTHNPVSGHPMQGEQNASQSTVSAATTSTTTSGIHREVVTSQNPKQIQLQCEVFNARTSQVIKCTKVTKQEAPVFRNITLKVKKYNSVSPNTPLSLKVGANQSCYLYVINIGSSGDVTVLIPNDFDPHNHVEADGFLLFPSSDEYEFELDENCGVETIVVLAYRDPLESTEQAKSDCEALRGSGSTELHRGITIKAKKPKDNVNSVLGSLEVQFKVAEK